MDFVNSLVWKTIGMDGNYYTLQEVVEKLGKTEAQVQDLVKQSKLREFREGAQQLFKVEEIDEFVQDMDELAGVKEDSFVELIPETNPDASAGDINEAFLDSLASTQENPAEDSLKLAETEMGADESLRLAETEMPAGDSLTAHVADAPAGDEDSFFANLGDTMPVIGEPKGANDGGIETIGDADLAASQTDAEMLANLTSADTSAGTTGVNVLAESEGEFNISDDGNSETKLVETGADSGLGDLDDDLNLDSVGSGSGLLDLSLQADDTSLGAVLDDILPSIEEGEAGDGAIVDEGEISDEADKIFEESAPSEMPAPGGAVYAPTAAVQQYVETPPDSLSNACGVALLFPFAFTVIAAIILVNATIGVTSALVGYIQDYLMYATIGLCVLVALIMLVGYTMGNSSGKAAKPKKAKKAKKPKKAKKDKKKKK